MTGVADLSVVIAAYTADRWDDLRAAVDSVRRQSMPVREIVVVIDHNDELLDRARRELSDVTVVANEGRRGLSGARNTGVDATGGRVVAFLDDDATADPGWAERLVAPYADPDTLGVGGAALPAWDDAEPPWFPEEFRWVVGCSYRGLPSAAAPVRNLIGCNMSIRREVLRAAGGFDPDLGRTADRPLGCEETELCIRARTTFPGGSFVYEPRAVVHHRVRPDRGTWAYFRSRCVAEGASKAWVASRVGADSALASERTHTLRILPAGVARGLIRPPGRRRDGAAQAAAIAAGFAMTAASYGSERALSRRRDRGGAARVASA